MSEPNPKLIYISAGVSDRVLFEAAKRLSAERYPARLAVIHGEMAERKAIRLAQETWRAPERKAA